MGRDQEDRTLSVSVRDYKAQTQGQSSRSEKDGRSAEGKMGKDQIGSLGED